MDSTKTGQMVLDWRPHPGPQTVFHQNWAYDCLFGGAKGPGKTECLLQEGLRQIDKKNYKAILFRRTYPQIGEIVDRSFKYFLGMGAKYSDKDLQLKIPAWTFPSGAKYAFGHVQHEKSKFDYQGKQFNYMGFDQIEQFTEGQFLYLIAQNRTSDPNIKCYVRASSNPGGVGHGWVKKRYIDPLFNPARPNEVFYKYFKRVDDEDIECDKNDPDAISRSFVFSTLFDNPSITENDPNYLRRLKQLSSQEQEAFIYGNWDVFKGQFFNMWRNSIHIQKKYVDPNFEKFLSLDYGYSNPSSIGFWQVDYDGNLHRYKEIYEDGLTYEELAKKVMEVGKNEKFRYCVADPAIWGDKSHHKKDSFFGESGAETIQRIWGGFCSLIKADNNRLTGWGRLRVLMTPIEDPIIGVYSKITCSPECVDSKRTIPSLVHDEERGNNEDLNSDGEDHAADDWRYAVMSRPIKTPKPEPKPEKRSLAWYLQGEKQAEYEKLLQEA